MTLFDHAMRYADFGWSILPVGPSKKPAVRSWKKYQQERPTSADLRRWFGGKTAPAGLAAVCGVVSGGLTVRDFDIEESYQRWAADFPELAKTLPTVKTGGGWHVYFSSAVDKTTNIDVDGIHEGELRGSGIVVLPPSKHTSGSTYSWTIPLPESGPLPFLDPVACGLLPEAVQQREQSKPREQKTTETTEDMGGVDPKSDKTIQAIIASTLPTGPGQRNRCIFELCRALKAEPAYADADPQQLRPILVEWHRRALPVILTKAFEETWIDFLQGWKRVKYPKGAGPMDAILERAKSEEPPTEAMMFEQPAARLLVSMCQQLQEHAGDGPFFLGCRTAGRLLGVDHVTVWRWLWLMQADGLLVRAERGGKSGGKYRATRYFYRRH